MTSDPAMTSDAQLLRRVAAGDQDALRELHTRHANDLRTLLIHRIGDVDLADLAIQDTFLAVWRGAGRWRGDGVVRAWLWGIALRRAIDHRRGRRPEPPLPPPAFGRSAEDELLERIDHGHLVDLLAQLPTDLQRVVQATVLDGLTVRETAVLLDLPTGTVKTRARRARLHLRTQLEAASHHSCAVTPQEGTT